MKQLLKTALFSALACAASGASAASGAAPGGDILVIASSTDRLTLADGRSIPVGFFLNEFAVPAQYLAQKGYRLVLATPSGAFPAMDQSSNSAAFFSGSEKARTEALQFVNGLKSISLRAAIDSGLGRYRAVFIPGGHAPMNDLMQNPELGLILRYFHEHGLPTAMICHGPVAALAALPQAADYRRELVAGNFADALKASRGWIYKGYRMTVLSDAEEWPGELKNGAQMPLHVEQALQIAGAHMDLDGLYRSHVVQDRELITGQNPASDLELARALDRALQGGGS